MKPKVKKWVIRVTLLGIASVSVYLCLLPRLLPRQLSWWWPDICFRGNADRKRLYLTIDDGPSYSTPAILAVLKKHNVPATFFIVGDQVHSDEQLRSIVEPGIHSAIICGRLSQAQVMSFDQFSADFDFTDQLLRRFSTPLYFRPPSASCTTQQIAYVLERVPTHLGNSFPLRLYDSAPSILVSLIKWLAIPGGIVIHAQRRCSGRPRRKCWMKCCLH